MQLEDIRHGWFRADHEDHVWIRPRKQSDTISVIEEDAQRLDPLEDWKVKAIWLRPLSGKLAPCVANHAQAQPYWETSC